MSALTELADWLDEQLSDGLASRQHIAERALARLREITAGPAPSLREVSPVILGQALRDAIAHQREHRAVEDWPGQISIYQKAARDLGLDPGDTSAPAGPVTDPSGRQLDEADVAVIRDSLSETMAAVSTRLAGWCDACMESPDGACGEHAADTGRAAAFRDLAERLRGVR